jgi:hypothetical protein
MIIVVCPIYSNEAMATGNTAQEALDNLIKYNDPDSLSLNDCIFYSAEMLRLKVECNPRVIEY